MSTMNRNEKAAQTNDQAKQAENSPAADGLTVISDEDLEWAGGAKKLSIISATGPTITPNCPSGRRNRR